MTTLVLDASVACDWLLDDELDPRAVRVAGRVSQDGALVPQLWQLEVRNALVTAERRGRLTAQGMADRLRALRQLPVVTDSEPDLDAVVALARSHRISIYDAVYLELAQRRRAALATLDADLVAAAAAAEVAVVP
ncbi:MAG: type II toxin-antitoxin system VapC family toxin [Chloroflexi bacterium]|nr:type II toxin-antitoxin system VapC family toxin [Chloroflexota bacterium]MCY4112148.1 type II toxin-antitoxin system VapC family toxin [Chloroflexota bacterium]